MMKKSIVCALLALFAVASAMAVGLETAKAEETADSFHFSLDLNKVDMENESDRLFSLLGPFNSKGFGYVTVPIQDGAVFTYDYMSSQSLSGMGGFEMQIRYTDAKGGTEYVYLSKAMADAGVTDQNGNSVSAVADMHTDLGNGWYHREIVLDYQKMNPAIVSCTLEHFMVYMAPTMDELRALDAEGVDSLEFWYRNVKFLNPDGTETIIYDGSNRAAVLPEFWIDFDFDIFSLGYAQQGTTYKFTPMTGYDTATGEYSITMECVPSPQPLCVVDGIAADAFFVTGQEYDLTENMRVSESGAALSVKSVADADGEMQAVAENKITFSERGVYTVCWQAVAADRTATYYRDIPVYDAAEPVFDDKDFEAVPKEAVAGDTVALPQVFAWLNGTKDFPADVTVKDPQGNPVPVSDALTFVPALKTEGNYIVTYEAVNGNFKTVRNCTVFVNDTDKPVVDFSALAQEIELGSVYEIPAIAITDTTDGSIGEYGLTLQNPYGETVPTDSQFGENCFLADISGYWKFTVTVTDSDENTVVSEYEMKVKPNNDAVYTLRVYVPEDKRAAGIQKRYNMSLYKTDIDNIRFEMGDMLVYEVYSETPMAGIGSFSGQFTGNFQGKSWPHWYEFYDGIVDQNGLSMAPDTDISAMLVNDEGDSVWYERSVAITGDLIGGDTALFSAIIDTTDACGEYIEVTYRNVRVVKAGGTEAPILPSSREIDPKQWEAINTGDAYLSATLDAYPVLFDQFLPAKAELGTEVFVSNRVVFDYRANRMLDASVTILDGAGNPVQKAAQFNGYLFTPQEAGTYTVIFHAENDAGPVELRYSFAVADTQAPQIAISDYPAEVGVGERFKVPVFTFTDAVTETDSLITSVKIYFNSREVLAQDGYLTPDAEGLYTIVAEAKDEAGNDNFVSVAITVTAGGGANVPAGDAPAWVLPVCIACGAVVLAAAAAGVCIAVRRKKKSGGNDIEK